MAQFITKHPTNIGIDLVLMLTDFEQAKSWPFQEARKIKSASYQKEEIFFETGYGPSGLPHIGTFGEVLRTTWVINAFKKISEKPTKLIVFSDDMDGLRKVPTNIPNQALLQRYIGKPLTSIPDPYGTHESFAAHNNARLQAFLDQFGFNYEFRSATQVYKSGQLDQSLLAVLENYDIITDTVTATLGDERRQTYSPFMPISPTTGEVLDDAVLAVDQNKKTILFRDSNGDEIETTVTGGKVKLQWKVDWAARWMAFNIDYEMAGRDLKPSYDLSSKIVHILGGKRPQGMIYELFLDENDQKISKSKGNGLSVEGWLKYGTGESLQHYLYDSPTSGKRLYFGSIQTYADKYIEALNLYTTQTPQSKIDNPVYHIHNGNPPAGSDVNFSMMLNIVSASGIDSSRDLQLMAEKYQKRLNYNEELMKNMAVAALANYNDLILPNKTFREPNRTEVLALSKLKESLAAVNSETTTEEAYQTIFYDVGKEFYGKDKLRDFFRSFYEITLGQTQGPRPGTLAKIIGKDKMLELLNQGTDVSGFANNS